MSRPCYAVVAVLVMLLACGSVRAIVTSKVYSVKDYGAAGDGKALETEAIQSAIDAAAEAGGGTVYFRPGDYISGTIRLKSYVTLHLEAGARLLGSENLEDYPSIVPEFRSYTDNYVTQSLIYGEKIHDVAIVGRGMIDGRGAAFKRKDYLNRPYLIRFVSCRNVLVRGVFLRNSAMWMQHYLDCDHVTVRGIRVENHCNYNNDGLNIDCSRNVHIADCTISSDDDSLCLKSTADRPTENVTITNCILSSHCNTIKMGTESNGGFKNISITNCVIRSPEMKESIYGSPRGLSGIALEIVDGGTLDRVTISNIAMTGVTTPLFMRLGNRARPFKKDMPKPGMGAFRNVSISNIIATNASKIGCSITGLPGYPVENVSLSNTRMIFDGGGTREDATRPVPEKPDSYPESTMFGVLPAYGFYCRHVKGLTLRNVSVAFSTSDQRPALVCDDVEDLILDGLSAEAVPDGYPTVILSNVRNAFIRGCRAQENTRTFLRLQDNTTGVSVVGNDLGHAQEPFEVDDTIQPGALWQASNRLE